MSIKIFERTFYKYSIRDNTSQLQSNMSSLSLEDDNSDKLIRKNLVKDIAIGR